ncbi:MAG: hypothetical protein A2583_01735 [Bdellovibrionales bacterium RIFOXYD1_FULL_53_11]|nr:MAG: hypothetical protein A2583_01735 [Bdellovibrionales bacterium RIFOXYD1_FULL_53_11]
MHWLQNLALSFVAVFAALDIVGTLPLYISLTNGMTSKQRTRTVDKSMIVALVVALAFIFTGNGVFSLLGIRVFDFKVAGGIVLLLVSLADLVGGPEAKQRSSGSTGIVPLAVPLITGPGVITTLILQVESFGYFITLGALFGNYILAWFLLRKAEFVTGKIGKDGTVVISKIAALLLAAIAVAMIRNGVFEAIAAFGIN